MVDIVLEEKDINHSGKWRSKMQINFTIKDLIQVLNTYPPSTPVKRYQDRGKDCISIRKCYPVMAETTNIDEISAIDFICIY